MIHEAQTFASRLLGPLALLRDLPSGHALLIPDCLSVHTLGMRFPIDVAFSWTSAGGSRCALERSVGASRVLVCPGARSR